MQQKPNQKPTPRGSAARRGTVPRSSTGGKASRRHPSHSALGVHQARVLLAEDDDDMRTFLCAALREAGYAVEAVKDGNALLDRIANGLLAKKQVLPDIVISDIRMPGWSGIDVLASLRQSDWSMPVILITAFGDDKTHAQAERLGAATLLDKPFDIEDLLNAASSILPARF